MAGGPLCWPRCWGSGTVARSQRTPNVAHKLPLRRTGAADLGAVGHGGSLRCRNQTPVAACSLGLMAATVLRLESMVALNFEQLPCGATNAVIQRLSPPLVAMLSREATLKRITCSAAASATARQRGCKFTGVSAITHSWYLEHGPQCKRWAPKKHQWSSGRVRNEVAAAPRR